jgi:spore maturation protein CgeB
MGFQVDHLDVSPLVETGGRIAWQLRLRLGIGPGIGLLNRTFVAQAKKLMPDIVFVDKGPFLWPASLEEVRRATGALLVHLNPDDPFGMAAHLGWRIFRKAIPHYDVHAVARDVNLQEYRAAGAKCVVRYHWAFDPEIHRPLPVSDEDREAFGGPVGFVGDWEADREELVVRLAEAGIPVRVWGPRWDYKCRRRPAKLRVEGKCLIGEDYARAVRAFDVNLGFLRKTNRDLSTTRSVEIPACGALLLAERTAEHQQLFREGEEAEFFASSDELVAKVRYYLAHPERGKAIAVAGRARCLASGYDHVSRQRQLLGEIESALGRSVLNWRSRVPAGGF